MKKLSSQTVKFKMKFIYLALFTLVANYSQSAWAAPRDEAKTKIQNEGKALFVAVADVTKYLAPFAGALGLAFIFLAGALGADEQEIAKKKKTAKIVVACLFGVTIVSWIVSLVSNKSV